MQGLESLNKFQNFMSSVGGLGRFEDTYMVHASEGETVVPMEVLNKSPILKRRLFKTMRKMGIDPERYIVGNEFNSLNPVTGQPEFFLKQVFKRIKKGIADVSGYAAPVIGAMYGPAAGAAAGAAMGSFKRENPGDPSQWQQMALRGGMSGLAANVAGGQNPLMGTGLRGGMGEAASWNPWDIGKHYLSPIEGATPWADYWNPSDFLSKLGLKDDNTSKALRNKKLVDREFGIGTWDKLDVTGKLNALDKLGIDIASGTGMSTGKLMAMFGLGTLGLGSLIGEPEDIRIPPGEFEEGPMYAERQLFPEGFDTSVYTDYASPIVPAAHGGIMDLQGGGFSQGPGTGTSDSIPAMLSDGEFVMTADAVRGAGGGSRREGARRMYQMMDRLEGAA